MRTKFSKGDGNWEFELSRENGHASTI